MIELQNKILCHDIDSLNILVVDPYPPSRFILENILMTYGLLFETMDAKHFIEEAKDPKFNENYDLIIISEKKNNPITCEIRHLLKETSLCNSCPIIMLTTESQQLTKESNTKRYYRQQNDIFNQDF